MDQRDFAADVIQTRDLIKPLREASMHKKSSSKSWANALKLGNAPCTKRYHSQKRQKLAETGQHFIHQFFSKHDYLPSMANDQVDRGEEENEDTVEMQEDNAEAHLQRLFPEDMVSNIEWLSESLVLTFC